MGHNFGVPQPANHVAAIIVGAPSLGGKPVGNNRFYGANDPRRNTGWRSATECATPGNSLHPGLRHPARLRRAGPARLVTHRGRRRSTIPGADVETDGLRFTVQGTEWAYHEKAYLMLHKPAGTECSQKPST